MAEESNAHSDSRKGKSVLSPPLLREAEGEMIVVVRQLSGLNPYGGRRMKSSDVRHVEGRESWAGSSKASTSSSPRHASKRPKLDHSEEDGPSKYFLKAGIRPRRAQAEPFASTSSHPALAIDDTIIIDGEDDTLATKDDPHEPIVLKTSSPDPMDIIGPGAPYAFDQNKPSPMNQFSSLVGDALKPPKDGPSTLRLRKQHEPRGSESASRPDGDGDDVSTSESTTARAEAPSGRSNVKTKVAYFEDIRDSTPHINLQTRAVQSRKSLMKPKQVGLCCPDLWHLQLSEL
jgi:hypothetical protein